MDDRLLHGLAQARERGVAWWKLVQEADGPQLDAVKEVLGHLLTKRRLEPPTALLRLADRLTGYTAVLANLPGAGRREADWRGFVELVGDLERGADDAFTVVRWLRQLHERGAGVPRPPIEAGHAVSLMTIHAAKGLEWPVVVIPDLARAMPSSSGTVVFDPEIGVSVDFGEEHGQPALHRLIKDKKARAEEDEKVESRQALENLRGELSGRYRVLVRDKSEYLPLSTGLRGATDLLNRAITEPDDVRSE